MSDDTEQRRERYLNMLLNWFDSLYQRAKAGESEEALRLEWDIYASNFGVHWLYINTMFSLAFHAIRTGADHSQARKWCQNHLRDNMEGKL